MDVMAARKAISEHLAVPIALVVDQVELRDLGADSLDLISMTMLLEERFNVRVSDDVAEACRTVEDVIETLRGLVETATPA